jgi:hypothetical protein
MSQCPHCVVLGFKQPVVVCIIIEIANAAGWMMQNRFTRRLELLREEARACLRPAKLTALEAERMRLRSQAALLAMQAELEERQQRACRSGILTGFSKRSSG